MKDPTYNKAEIERNGIWLIAFVISEMINDKSPIGWSNYIPAAEEAVKKAKNETLTSNKRTKDQSVG